MYFKVIVSQNIVGVVNDDNFRKILKKKKMVTFSDIESGQFVELNEKYYRDDWMRSVVPGVVELIEADVVRIDEQEYNAILQALETEEVISDEQEPVLDETDQANTADEEQDTTLEFVKTRKLEEVTRSCNSTIENGFFVTLSDGAEHHFTLTTNDQLNLITLSAMITAGESQIPYQAEGELAVFYSNYDAQLIYDTAVKFRAYHMTYLNSLKSYVGSLESVEDIANVTYGIEIPEEYQSDVLKSFQTP